VDPGTSVKSAGAEVGRGAALDAGRSDVAAADSDGREAVDDGEALASSLIPPVAAAEVGTVTLGDTSCLSHSMFLP
jgi:hypothetical protein